MKGLFGFVDSRSGFWKNLMAVDGSFSWRRREASLKEHGGGHGFRTVADMASQLRVDAVNAGC